VGWLKGDAIRTVYILHIIDNREKNIMSEYLSALAIARGVQSGKTSAQEQCAIALERAKSENPKCLALRSIDSDAAIGRAQEVDRGVKGGAKFALAGVPVVIKDNIGQAGRITGAGRPNGCGAEAQVDSPLVTRLLEAGAVIVGRANMDELAYGVTGSNGHTGQVKNPLNLECHPGGSSAGSAASVAAKMAPLAIGTDTAGSVRIPSALCGLVGLRPTTGLLPSQGIAPLSRSLDTAGPIARSVGDLALLLSVLAANQSYANATAEAIPTGTRAIVLSGKFAIEVDAEVGKVFEEAVAKFAKLGIAIAKKEEPAIADGPKASGPIIGAEAAYAWAKELEAHPDWFGEEVRGHLTKGATILAGRYLRALDDANRVTAAINRLFQDASIIVLPTTATAATPISNMGAQLKFLALTVPFSLGGFPAISIPMGKVNGMPVGIQIVAKRNEEALLLRVGAALEKVLS
jgi:aspartyl-tRNA(Asn)/glutamyl-tRNA(Gln) amidotransferase subunit A